MHGGLRVLGLIPARGGSKGLPGKNTRALAGRPLIAWTVTAALESAALDAVVVSTDDAAIAAAAREAGAEVPFRRPADLARDGSRMLDVVLHALDALERDGRAFDLVALLQPTSPLRTAADIDGAVARLVQTRGHAVASVTPVEHSPRFANALPADGSLADFLRPGDATANRQELPREVRLNGAVYVAETAFIRAGGAFVGDGAFAYEMPQERSVDIDTELDFTLAECLLARRAAEQA